MRNATHSHLDSAKTILRYLKGNLLGLQDILYLVDGPLCPRYSLPYVRRSTGDHRMSFTICELRIYDHCNEHCVTDVEILV
jgi:hypothetical protein